MPDKLPRFNEAIAWLESEPLDPITKRLIHLGIFCLITKAHSQGVWPAEPWDVKYYVELLRDVFTRHEALKRLLAGEKVGQFFDDDEPDGFST